MIADILEGAAVRFKTAATRKDELIVHCPFCQERGHDPYTDTLGINVKSGWGHCFRCGWKSSSMIRTVQELSRVLGVPVTLPSRYRLAQESKNEPEKDSKAEPTGLPEGYETFNDKTDEVEKLARRYLESRQVSMLQIVRHRVGYAGAGKMAYRIIFPVIGSDNCIYGAVGRAFWPDLRPKYLNTPGIKLLWNAQRTGSEAVIVEGIMDALRVESALLSTRGVVPVARLGSAITNVQLSQLRSFQRVVIFPDHDRAGVYGAIELAKRCSNVRLPVSVVVPKAMDDADPGSMNSEQILDELASALVWSESVEHRLRAATGRRNAY